MAIKESFTEKRVLEFPVPALSDKGKANQAIYWDAKTPGLGLRVTTGNSRAYVFQAQIIAQNTPNSKPITIRMTIGDLRTWSVGKAQEEARQLKAKTDRGIDPRQERAKQIQQDLADRTESKRRGKKLNEAWGEYCAAKSSNWGEYSRRDHHRVIQSGGLIKTRGSKRGGADKTGAGPLFALADVQLVDRSRKVVKQWLATAGIERPTQAALAFRLRRGFINCAVREGALSVHADACPGVGVVVLQKAGEKYVGRVIAAGGDTVEITEDEKVKINGSKIVENDIFYNTPQYESDTVYPLTLNSGEYFILGDQRGNAKDSRYFGAVKDKEIKGRVITVLRRSDI